MVTYQNSDVLLALWRDSRNNIVDIVVLSSNLSEIDIMNEYIEAKAFYGHHVIGSNEYYCAFSDGTRVNLTLHGIITNVIPRVIKSTLEAIEGDVKEL